jgi:hypothetical protein
MSNHLKCQSAQWQARRYRLPRMCTKFAGKSARATRTIELS